MRDLKYLIAYLVPASALLGLTWQGAWSWLTVVLVFGILPAIELYTPKSIENVPKAKEDDRASRTFFDWLLYANAPLLFGIVGWYLWTLAAQTLSLGEITGLTLSVGIVVGTCGINVAHELGHRPNAAEQVLAQIMLLPALYQHFFVEHNRGHHKNVATDDDPASARLGENVFRFWLRSVLGGWQNAWALERERLAKTNQAATSWDNAMLRYSSYQVIWLVAIFSLLGWHAFLGAISIAIISFLLLETVNYIEHYGLRRKILPTGRPEPVSPHHSWNSDHELGRIFLYELTRHSDHHFKSTRKYQILRHIDESPQLPYGYPTSIVIAMIPPIWFRVMNARAVQRP
ncbi:MAG: alkane 1-monooxygenase [Phycisphaerae bacterium]|nr:alkane 1-monooxygenase [Saprospiraceae bacterium]